MYTRTERPIPFFLRVRRDLSDITSSAISLFGPDFSLSVVLSSRHKLFQNVGTTELEVERKLEALGSRSRLSIPDIVCFIYGKALGLLASTPVVPETWGVRTPGK